MYCVFLTFRRIIVQKPCVFDNNIAGMLAGVANRCLEDAIVGHGGGAGPQGNLLLDVT